MLVAIAIILDQPFLKIRVGVNGGSVSLTMVALFVISLRFNPIKSFIGCGLIYGFITCLLDGWGFATFPLDYLLGYGSLCFLSIFRNKIQNLNGSKSIFLLVIGIIVSVTLRCVFSSISSIIFYGFTIRDALLYNVLYLGPSLGITLIVLLVLYKPLKMINNRFPRKSIC